MADRLANEYWTMLGTTKLPDLLRSVSQDAQTESFDMNKSHGTVSVAADAIESGRDGELNDARRALIGWLNSLWWHIVKVAPDINESQPVALTAFLWEMNTRISKMLVVSMVLEGRNLRGFGATPEKSDIPQCLVHLWERLDVCRKRFFPQLEKEYAKSIDRLPSDYTRLYLETQRT